MKDLIPSETKSKHNSHVHSHKTVVEYVKFTASKLSQLCN